MAFIETARFGPPWAAVRATGAARNAATSSWRMPATVRREPPWANHAPNAVTCRRYWPIVWGDRPSASSWTRNIERAAWSCILEGSGGGRLPDRPVRDHAAGYGAF